MKHVPLIALLALILCLSACSILPEEEQFAKAPVIRQSTTVDYKLAPVLRGELTHTESLSCQYRAVMEETLSFRIGNELYSEIYVEKGDQVKAGDLLAELYMGDLNDQISRLEYALEGLSLEILHEKENRDAALEKHRLYLEGLEKEEREKADTLDDVRKEWDTQIERLEDKFYIESMRLEEYRTDRRSRQLVAGIDGTVTYLRSIKEGDRSVEGERFIKLADSTQNVFVGETKNHTYLKSGDMTTVTVKKVDYEAMVMTSGDLGIENRYEADSEKQEVFFMLLEPAVELEAGDRGTVIVLMDERTEALYVQNNAVVDVDGESAVYVKDEFGLKSVRKVETGLVTSKYTEIVTGLTEGEFVIIN